MKKTLKKTFMVSMVLCLLSVAFVFSAYAADESGICGENAVWSFNSETGVLTISGEGDMYGYIGAFGDNQNDVEETTPFDEQAVKKVIIESGITSVGQNAFDGFSLLESVEMADSVKTICDGAFHGCGSLAEIKLSQGLKEVEPFAFMDCSSLRKLNFPATLESIGIEALYGTASLEELTVDENNPYLMCENFTIYSKDKSVLYICVDRDINYYESPESLKTVMPYAFFYCFELKEVVFGESVSDIRYLPVSSYTEKITVYNPYCEMQDSIFTDVFCGYEKSTTKEYAQDNCVDFIALECDHHFGFSDWAEDKCAEKATRECSTCYYTEEKEIEVSDEEKNVACTFSEWSVAERPACNKKGTEKRSCVYCGYTQTRELPALQHTFSQFIPNNDASCVSDGTKTAVCSNGCGTLKTVTDEGSMSPDNHSFTEWETVEGREVRTCTECGYTETQEVPELSFFEKLIQTIVDFFKRLFGII